MTIHLRVDYRLDGASNFISWKERIVFLLHECELWDIVENSQMNLMMVTIDSNLLEPYTKKNIK
jgi:hypothetical protein